jgi:hypothetical protein
MEIRCEPADEYPHEVGPEEHFNESVYTNCFDPATGLGAFFRLGNRPNEGRGEVTVCLWLPDGRVGFMFQRPAVHGNEFRSAGLSFNVIEPFTHLEVTYDGPVLMLDDPTLLNDPRQAFTESPTVTVAASLTLRGASAMFGGEPTERIERPGEEFARGHTEQLVTVTGTITVDGERHSLNGAGLRDHSWGPRTWQAPWWYRWLTGNLDDGSGFMVSRIGRRDSDGVRAGFVWENGELHLCNHAEVTTTWADDGISPAAIDAVLAVRDSEGTELRRWNIHGDATRPVPLRNRRDGQITRIAEAPTRWSLDDGRQGQGIAEYLDQVIDGHPVGLDAS